MTLSEVDRSPFLWSRSLFLLSLLSLLVGMAGCVSKQPHVALPQDMPVLWDYEQEQELPVTSGKILDLLDDSTIEALAREALQNNPDLGVTSDRLMAQAALLGVSRARLWPSIDINFSANRGNQSLDATGSHMSSSVQRASIGLRWEIDIWGKIRDEYNARGVALDKQSLEYSAARDSLLARTIQAWIRTVSLANSIQISEQRVKNLEKIQERVLFRYRDGIGKIDELSTASTRILKAKANKVELVEKRTQSIRELEVLVGRYPENLLAPDKKYPKLELPKLFKPSEVLVNRPDVRAAIEGVRAATLQQRAAEKSYLPSFVFTGNLFTENISLPELVNGTLLWEMILSASQPVFNAGRIRSEVEARKWEHSASLKKMKATILNAVGEVKKYWGREQMLASKEVLLEAALLEATKSYAYFEKRYLGGLDSIINMLNAKEEQIGIQAQINELQATKLVNRIDLALALGFGERT